ncbi:MAG: hypothetical protein ACYTDT_08265 [Planctomycetota bacterium]|jgi:hypothetical protein
MARKLTSLLILALAGSVLLACTPSKSVEYEWDEDIPRAQYLYEVKCTRCHDYYDPADFRQKTMRYNFKKYAAKSGIQKYERAAVLQWALDRCRDATPRKSQ